MNQMSRQEILDAILPLSDPQNAARRLQWLIDLGYQMTISARSGYPTVETKSNILLHSTRCNTSFTTKCGIATPVMSGTRLRNC